MPPRSRWSRWRGCGRCRSSLPSARSSSRPLARSVEPVELPAGTVVIREGEAGDCFYVVADGEVVVWQGETRVRELGRGECFGAIALVRDVPRTATVVAKTDVRLDSLDQAAFLLAVTGHEPTARAAEELVAAHLGHAAGTR